MQQPGDVQPSSCLVVTLPEVATDLQPSLSDDERVGLAAIVARRATVRRGPWIETRAGLARVVGPAHAALARMGARPVDRRSVIELLIVEMHDRGTAFWSWSGDDWLDLIHRAGKWPTKVAINRLIALAYCLAGFDRVDQVGRFFYSRVAAMVFGRDALEQAKAQLRAAMEQVSNPEVSLGHAAHALPMAFLIQRSSRLGDLTPDTLARVAVLGQDSSRDAPSLSRALGLMGLLKEPAKPPGMAQSSASFRSSAARRVAGVEGVDPEWLAWCQEWRRRSPPTKRTAQVVYTMLGCGRWLRDAHPDIRTPADWTSAIAFQYTAAVLQMTTRQWSSPASRFRTGKPLRATSKLNELSRLRRFFGDLQNWGLIPVRFEPIRALASPRHLKALAFPDPPVINEGVWDKLVDAGLRLTDADMRPPDAHPGCESPSSRYPIAMVRAVAMIWLFAGLRPDQICRMLVGSVQWDAAGTDSAAPYCLITTPSSKWGTTHTKPVHAAVGRAIEAWEQERPWHPAMVDRISGEDVDYLFARSGSILSKEYINHQLIPALCRKAGVLASDPRGRITAFRARATVASRLANGFSLFGAQAWLNHRSATSTGRYLKLSIPELARLAREAGLLKRNVRSTELLKDPTAPRDPGPVHGEPWRFFDLGHGLCTYDRFDRCSHRLACASCSFYRPKASARAQALEASLNLARMLREQPLLEAERLAVQDGLEVMIRLLTILEDEATPSEPPPTRE